MAGAIDPTGARKDALDAFLKTKLEEGFVIERTRIPMQSSSRRRRSGAGSASGANRYVVSVDENGEVTMIQAEPERS